MLFKPAPLEILINLVKGFFTFWLLILAPTFLGFLLMVYTDLPLIGYISGYGLLGIIIALIRSSKSKIEVKPNLEIITVKAQKSHPELLTSTVIINVIFALQAVGMWFIFSR